MDALTLMSCFNKTAIFILYKIGKLKFFNPILGNLIWNIAYFNQHLSAGHFYHCSKFYFFALYACFLEAFVKDFLQGFFNTNTSTIYLSSI